MSAAGEAKGAPTGTTVAETVWERGRFDARGGPGKVLFGRMYEDASIEFGAFRPGGRVLCIASAGCTAMTLAPRHEVVAVDINSVQLAYAERRFAGDRGGRGAAERVMAFGRSFAPLAGWWPSRLRAFLDLDLPAEQTAYWRRHLDTRRFRAVLDGLMSLTALRAVYASPFLDFLPPRLGAVMRGRMERCFARHSNRANPYARALLLGELPDVPPPPEAKDIRLVHADAAACLEREPAGSFDGFALSNILDGADAAYEQRLIAAVKRAAAPGAVVVLRSFREAPAALPTNRAAEDRAMLWGIVDVRPAATL
jgi:S-adenosylmethionine:diacylglycerol 3-amino-3-carboxypropyl transferase